MARPMGSLAEQRHRHSLSQSNLNLTQTHNTAAVAAATGDISDGDGMGVYEGELVPECLLIDDADLQVPGTYPIPLHAILSHSFLMRHVIPYHITRCR